MTRAVVADHRARHDLALDHAEPGREQIKFLSKSENPIYHKDVVQMGFNAWHYADGNLWCRGRSPAV